MNDMPHVLSGFDLGSLHVTLRSDGLFVRRGKDVVNLSLDEARRLASLLEDFASWVREDESGVGNQRSTIEDHLPVEGNATVENEADEDTLVGKPAEFLYRIKAEG